MNAAIEHDLFGGVWKYPFLLGTESNEVRAVITLKMSAGGKVPGLQGLFLTISLLIAPFPSTISVCVRLNR